MATKTEIETTSWDELVDAAEAKIREQEHGGFHDFDGMAEILLQLESVPEEAAIQRQQRRRDERRVRLAR